MTISINPEDRPNPGEVLVQFVCQTGGTNETPQHDPDRAPDSRVRDSHRAFHGKVFRLSEAPIPPLDWGCRCAIQYLSDGDDNLPPVPEPPVASATAATDEWLRANVNNVQRVFDAERRALRSERIEAGRLAAISYKISSPAMIAQMVADVLAAEDRANPALQALRAQQSQAAERATAAQEAGDEAAAQQARAEAERISREIDRFGL